MARYTPQPVDTSSVALDPSLLDLAEYLARNSHEVWVTERERQGWTLGPQRDDAGKKHPCLIPYEELPESEKQLDRETAMETLKLIVAMGYKIEPPAKPVTLGSMQSAGGQDIASMELAQLVQRWKDLGPGQCHGAAEVYMSLGRRANDHGEYLLAYDIFKEGLRFYPGHAPLTRLQATALQRSGAPYPAARILEKLIDEGNVDDETVGLLASSYKDLWRQSVDPDEARQWLVKATDTYQRAFDLHAGYWPAINVATLSAFLGDKNRSHQFAVHARDDCLRQLPSAGEGEKYWLLATIGEAWLLLHDLPKAEQYYAEAGKVSGRHLERIRSTRAQARLILNHLGVSETERMGLLRRCLDLPRVVVFSGHQIDSPGRTVPRFPASVESEVGAAIERALEELNCGFGYASAACGGDILFLEALLKRNAEANIILPFEPKSFLECSIARNGGNWAERFQKLLNTPGVRVTATSQAPLDEGISYDYSNLFTFGLAGIRADRWGAELATLTVWDGKRGNGPGGTHDAVLHWRKANCEPIIINPMAFVRGGSSSIDVGDFAPSASDVSARPESDAGSTSDREVQPRMAALVFTDIVGYSSLNEAEIRLVIRHVLRPVTEIASANGRKPLHMSTWGDAFYVVFGSVAEAGNYALDLADMVIRTKWMELGFSKKLAVRTALHFGPVYSYTNPTSKLTDFIGTHVSRAARMEPITPPNNVYASEAFAAISFAERVKGFSCDYVGKLGLAKNYGTFPAYHVRRSGAAGGAANS